MPYSFAILKTVNNSVSPPTFQPLSTTSTTHRTSASRPLPPTSPARSSIGMHAVVGSSWITSPNSWGHFPVPPTPRLVLAGASGVVTKKQAIVNVKNTTDSMCFVWSVLSCIHPAPHHPHRVSNYMHHQNSLNLSGLTIPVPIHEIPKFEKQNPSISVNVLCKGDDAGFAPLYVSKERDRYHHVNLFLIE